MDEYADELEELEDRPRCGKCGSADLRYSHKRKWWDELLLSVFGYEVFRCRKCHTRLHIRTDWQPPDRGK
jgi:ribosomal protein L40E